MNRKFIIFLIRDACLRRRRRSIAGISLVQIVIVLGVIGIVLGAIWVVASTLFTSNKVSIATQQLQTTVHNIRTIYAEQGGVTDTGGGALMPALDQLKAFPIDMRQDALTPAGIIFHIWSSQANNGLGSVSVDADDCAGNANAAGVPQPCFGITFYDVSQNACALLVTETSQLNAGLQQVQVNAAVAGDINIVATPLPVPASSAIASCNNSNASSSNDILWIYSIRGSGS